jgi:hypothetical protein
MGMSVHRRGQRGQSLKAFRYRKEGLALSNGPLGGKKTQDFAPTYLSLEENTCGAQQ